MNLKNIDDILIAHKFIQEQRKEKAKDNILAFTRYTMPTFQSKEFHVKYYNILNKFAKGEIKKLMISVPPQHGKSEGSTRRLPPFMFGNNPNLKIAIASYNTPFARKFNRDIQRIIDTEEYSQIFPDVKINGKNIVTTNNYLRNADEFEIINHQGSLKAVGRGGSLTGNPVDVMIMDDLYKDYAEGNSPVIRDAVWEWYTSVVLTRLHNNSQQLIVFTRWHEDDLIGRIQVKEKVCTYQEWENDKTSWLKINWEAIKGDESNDIDTREKGQALWPEKHSVKKLEETRSLDPIKFDCMYQGNPISKQGLLYSELKTYSTKPEFEIIKSYCDTADTGDDYLLNIVYGVKNGIAYVLDVDYTNEPVEVTINLVAGTILKNGVNLADIESNNGGRIFALNVSEIVKAKTTVNWFHQNLNKESRCISNAANVMRCIAMPDDWHIQWPELYLDITRFKRNFKANKHDEVADVLTGIFERMNIYMQNEALTLDY